MLKSPLTSVLKMMVKSGLEKIEELQLQLNVCFKTESEMYHAVKNSVI